MSRGWLFVVGLLVGIIAGAGYMWVEKRADVLQAERAAHVASTEAREAAEEAAIEIGRGRSAWILSTAIVVRSGAIDHLDRLIGVGYGRGFGDACNELGATEAECDDAAARAGDLCIDLPDEELCVPTLPGYFHLPRDLERQFRTVYQRRVLGPLVRTVCSGVDTRERLSPDVVRIFEKLCFES